MKIVVASDSFKGSLTSKRIIELFREAAGQTFPDAKISGTLVADGGEGTMDAVVEELQGSYRKLEVKGPLFEPVQATYGLLPGNKAIIEMAQASGLPLVPENLRNPMETTSYGTGMLIRDALDRGVRHMVIAIGGSATNDGGMGAMSALGVQFFDREGKKLSGKGADLACIDRVDMKYIHPAVKETEFIVMCDVTNPLLGEKGATRIFAPQKGADKMMIQSLENGMENYARLVKECTGCNVWDTPGSGAAGGLGFALMAFLRAQLKPGIETVLDLIHFDEQIKDADLVITGEGRMDGQSVFGKVPSGVGKRCMNAGVPAAAIVGGLMDGYEEIYKCGICTVITTVNGVMTMDEALGSSEDLYKDAAYRLLGAIKCGMKMKDRNI